MKGSGVDDIIFDLLNIPSLIDRAIKRKLVKDVRNGTHMDVTHHQFQIVRLLDEEGTLHVAEIAKKLEIARAQMTKLIDKLVELDLVERQPNADDRRVIDISLTKHGKSAIKADRGNMQKVIREKLSVLSAKEVKDLGDALKKIRIIFDKIN